MTTTITTGASRIAPTILTGLSESAEGGTRVHKIINRANADITLRVAGLRSGLLEMGFAGPTCEADSAAAFAILRTAAVFTLSDTDRPSYNMAFVVPEGGRIERAIEDQTRAAYILTVDFQEVQA